MKKIAMYTTLQLFGSKTTGGLKRFVELYYGLVSKGVNVDLYCADNPNILKEKKIIGYSLISKKESRSIFLPTQLKLLLSNMNYVKRIKDKSYDQIIVFDVPTAIGLCLMGVKNIQLFIRQDLIEYRRIAIKERTKSRAIISLYLAFLKLCETICLLKAQRIIIQCKYDYNALIRRHALIKKIVKKKSIIQINNVNPSWIVSKSNEDNNETKNIFKKREESFTICFVGDFSSERKGHRIFVDAIKNLIDEGFELEAILIGGGKKLSAYKEECANYPAIKFMGRLGNPLGIIKQCDLMVVPSLADSCPNTVMEALYNNIPVIGARSGGIPEILENEDALFEPNCHSLQSKIVQFIDRDNLYTLRRQQLNRRNELDFDWPSIILKHLGIEEK